MKDNKYVMCPFCKDDYEVSYTHLIGYAPYFNRDNQLCLHLTFGCEAGHYFEKYVQQHKGYTIIQDEKDN